MRNVNTFNFYIDIYLGMAIISLPTFFQNSFSHKSDTTIVTILQPPPSNLSICAYMFDIGTHTAWSGIVRW